MYNLEKLRSDNNLLTIAEQAGAKFKQYRNEYRSRCPIHGGDNPTAFVVYIDNGVQKYKCFTREECGAGDVIDFVQSWRKCSITQACEWLGGEKVLDQSEIDRIAAQRAINEIERLQEATERAVKVLEELRQIESWRQYHKMLEDNIKFQRIWEDHGIPIEWQNYWQLGYCNQFTVNTHTGKWTTPTLTIPIFTGENWDLQNIKHRLLNPIDPRDKYRPEKPGLASYPYFCYPEIMYDADRILVVEGEKKAMVTYLTLNDSEIQVIGLPGKNQWKSIVENLTGKNVYVLLDPDALKEANEFSKLIGGKLINITMKVDDAIIDGLLDRYGLERLLAGARKFNA